MGISRDAYRLRETVKHTEGQTPSVPADVIRRRNPLPKLAKAQEAMAAFDKGQFTLVKNLPDKLIDADAEVEAYAFCSMSRGQYALLHRCSGEDSGGFWLAVPCNDTSDPEPVGICEGCIDKKMPLVSLTISGLADNTNPRFDDWAGAVNGVHALQTRAPFSLCNPGVIIKVPGNTVFESGDLASQLQIFGPVVVQVLGSADPLNPSSGAAFTPPPFGISSFTQPLSHVALYPYPRLPGVDPSADPYSVFASGANFWEVRGPTVYRESGATPLSRTEGKVDCTQTYNTYDELYSGIFEFGQWLADGPVVFSVTPT